MSFRGAIVRDPNCSSVPVQVQIPCLMIQLTAGGIANDQTISIPLELPYKRGELLRGKGDVLRGRGEGKASAFHSIETAVRMDSGGIIGETAGISSCSLDQHEIFVGAKLVHRLDQIKGLSSLTAITELAEIALIATVSVRGVATLSANPTVSPSGEPMVAKEMRALGLEGQLGKDRQMVTACGIADDGIGITVEAPVGNIDMIQIHSRAVGGLGVIIAVAVGLRLCGDLPCLIQLLHGVGVGIIVIGGVTLNIIAGDASSYSPV